jgi:O-antigen/teichoic acid export membrane protein
VPSLKQKAVRGLKWQAIEIGGRQLLSLVVFTTLARLLDPSAFGLAAMVGVYLAIVAMFAEQGMGAAIVQRKTLEPQHLHTAFWFTTCAAAILFGLSQAIAPWVSRLMEEPLLTPLLRWASIALLLNSLASVHTALFARELEFRRPAIRVLLANLAGGVVGVALALSGYGVWSLVFQQLTVAAVGLIVIWSISSYRPKMLFSLAHLRELMGVSSAVFATGALWFISSRADQYFIGRFLGAESLGVYNVAGKIPEMARVAFIQPVSGISVPALARMQHDHTKVTQAIVKGMGAVAFIALPVFVGMVVVAPSLVPVVFGAKWTGAVPLVQLLAIYQLVVSLCVFCHPALLTSGSPGVYTLFNLAGAIGTVIACIVGVQYGASYILIGMIINLSVILLFQLVFLQRRIGLRLMDYLSPCAVPAALSSIMAAGVWTISHSTGSAMPEYASLALQVLVGVALYGVGSLVVQPPGLMLVRSLLKKNLPETCPT